MVTTEESIRSSGEDAIELIRDHRNDVIEKLFHVDFLKSYLQRNFQRTDLSDVKLEYIGRVLRELKASPLDLMHYASLILETRKNGSFSISRNTEHYFQKDIERTIQNYL